MFASGFRKSLPRNKTTYVCGHRVSCFKWELPEFSYVFGHKHINPGKVAIVASETVVVVVQSSATHLPTVPKEIWTHVRLVAQNSMLRGGKSVLKLNLSGTKNSKEDRSLNALGLYKGYWNLTQSQEWQ